MSSQEISLKWNGYQNNILSSVKDLFKDEELSDVTLVSEGQIFKAHKVILSANSSVFRTIFQQNPHKDPIIVLHDINKASLKTLLTFMYNGEVNVTEEFLPILLKTADTLRISGLSTESEVKDEGKGTPTTTHHAKKRKRSEHDESQQKPKKGISSKIDPVTNINCDSLKVPMTVLKEEPIDSPLTDYSGDNTNDTDLTLFDDPNLLENKINSESLASKAVCLSVCNDHNVNGKKWISEVSSTHPCLNLPHEKNGTETFDEDKDSIEIDKEVETVLQSGTIVESLSVATDGVPCDAKNCKDKNNACYANPLFPCPFCHRVYNSWGYRRRHVKSRHTTNRLSCKWCALVLSSTGAWYSHATRVHGVPHEEARNSLVVMVEAHSVLTLNEPSVAQLLGQVGMTANENSNSEKPTVPSTTF